MAGAAVLVLKRLPETAEVLAHIVNQEIRHLHSGKVTTEVEL